ncbi:MAG: Flp family type IVb pilin [Thermoguttaceae bacterium]
MKSLFWTLRLFLSDEDGPTAVEYAVLLSLIVSVCLAAITTIGSNVANVFSNVANQL